jgi:hypothetical protein
MSSVELILVELTVVTGNQDVIVYFDGDGVRMPAVGQLI